METVTPDFERLLTSFKGVLITIFFWGGGGGERLNGIAEP